MTENLIVKQLQGIASKLTGDADLQKDLMQEMFVYLVHIQTTEPGQRLDWYLKNCEFHARHYCKLGRDIDLPGHTNHGESHHEFPQDTRSCEPVGPIEIQGERITRDILNLILPLLTEKQQQVLFLLMKRCGVREAARELGITHPAVIKHRKKIARIARELLQESEGVGEAIAVHNGIEGDSNGNGHGSGNGNGDPAWSKNLSNSRSS